MLYIAIEVKQVLPPASAKPPNMKAVQFLSLVVLLLVASHSDAARNPTNRRKKTKLPDVEAQADGGLGKGNSKALGRHFGSGE